MFKHFLTVAVMLLAGSFFELSAQDEIIKVNTTLVSVPVIVRDRDGRYIPDLKAADFSMLRDGQNQKIDFFASSEEPINVAVLIDTSHSTAPVLDDIKKAADRFVKLLGPRDKAAIVSFDFDTHVLSPLTSDASRLKNAIRDAEIPKMFGTTLRDAVAQTVNQEFAGVTGRKAIILLTDGKDVGSFIGPQSLISSLQESDVMIYSVLFETGMPRPQFSGGMGGRGIFGPGFPRNDRFPGGARPDRSPRRNPQRQQRVQMNNERAQEFLETLSEVTAGRFYTSKSSKFKETFDLIVDELRHQYRLGFYPPEEAAAGAIHDIKVKVSRPNVAVSSRSYYRSATK
jgi:VWFA-related protein